MSSQEQSNQMPEQNPIDMKHADKFDAEGNPRTMHKFEDGRIALLSEQEYKDELEAIKEK